MAKDTQASRAAAPNPIAPLFQVARAVLNEIDQQADRWLEYTMSQTGEAAKLAHAVRAQSFAATRATLDSVEKLASGAWDTAAVWSQPSAGASA
jgi:hypothetical protein